LRPKNREPAPTITTLGEEVMGILEEGVENSVRVKYPVSFALKME
jgi:hypothetical protein